MWPNLEQNPVNSHGDNIFFPTNYHSPTKLDNFPNGGIGGTPGGKIPAPTWYHHWYLQNFIKCLNKKIEKPIRLVTIASNSQFSWTSYATLKSTNRQDLNRQSTYQLLSNALKPVSNIITSCGVFFSENYDWLLKAVIPVLVVKLQRIKT